MVWKHGRKTRKMRARASSSKVFFFGQKILAQLFFFHLEISCQYVKKGNLATFKVRYVY